MSDRSSTGSGSSRSQRRGPTTLNRERRALELVEQCLEVPPPDRTVWLDQNTSGDELLRRRVDALLAQIAEGDTIAGEGPGKLSDGPTEALDPSRPSLSVRPHHRGELVERYRIDREIGRGGMGVVYRATRADDAFDMAVAIKVMQGIPGGSTERFERERQVLARLRHPNVARILDGGSTADGSPYVAMELVDGTPIDRYCKEHDLGVRESIELFLQVCDAVSHAHRNLVVHRDLKPGNILVTDEGEPKLLDFGIAKLLDTEEGDGALTRMGLGPMTPEYASPEQVRHEPITVATDVYSLGVVLYELLTGRRPYSLESRSPREVEQLICDTRPPAPSRVVRTNDPNTGRTGPSAEALGRQLEGDLDTVVLTALAKDVDERYATVDELADDLRRVLDHRPIQARPHTWTYLLRSALRRNSRRVAVAGVILLALLAALGWGLVQNLRAAAEGRRALAEAQKLESTNQFLDSLFTAPDPVWGLGRDASVTDLLEVALERVDDLESPEGRCQIRRTIGSTYYNLGLVERAEEILADAHRRAIDHFGRAHMETALTAQRLALVASELGQTGRALEILEQTVPIFRREGSDQLEVVTAQYARTLAEAGQPERAGEIHRDLVQRIREHDQRVPDDVTALNNYAVFLMDQGDYERAEPILREAVELHERTPGAPESQLAGILANLASIASTRRDIEVAEPAYRRSIEISARLLGEDHPDLLLTRTSLANLYLNVGRLEDAASVTADVLKKAEGALPPGHPVRGYVQVVHSGILVELGRGAEIESVIREVIAERRTSLPEGHWLISSAENLLGASLLQQGRLDEAEQVLQRALADLRASVGEDHEKTRQAVELLDELESGR